MVLGSPRQLVVVRMTATHRQPDTATQSALFGDDKPVPTPRSADPRDASQDPELIATVVKTATDPGYLLVEKSGRVFRIDPATPGVVTDAAARHEQDAVHQLVDSGHLTIGGTHHIHHRGHEGPARSVLVPKNTRDMVTRWDSLHPIPAQDRRAQPAPSKARRKQGRAEDKPISGRIVVDVVRPGRGLLTCAEFNGQIIRDQGRYVVETEGGHIVGRTCSSYRTAAQALARHHGYQPGPIEIDRSEERDGNTPPPRSARDRQLGR